MDHPLAHLIPSSQNPASMLSLAAHNATSRLDQLVRLYDPDAPAVFYGAFGSDTTKFPDWAVRIEEYNRQDFHQNTPGKLKRFSDIASTLTSGDGLAFPNFRHALDLWIAGGQKEVKPYSCEQDYGSCVDACTAEQEDCLFGWRAVRPEFREMRKHTSAWYKYANRGYCSDGWGGSGVAAVARRVGCAFRIKYDLPGGSIDFTDDDVNEQVVARQWCRNGIPGWMEQYTQANHAYEDGAITEFDGSTTADVRSALASGGVLQTGGTNTSGGSKPFTIGRVGGHMQTVVGGDDSEDYRKFCKDVIGVTPRADDFPVVFNQTWGPGWSGECADRYWPPWWGPKPEGAWVWWASDLLRYFRGDIWLWLPKVKGFPSTDPVPVPLPQPPGPNPPPPAPYQTGELFMNKPDGTRERYLVIPTI